MGYGVECGGNEIAKGCRTELQNCGVTLQG